MRLKYHLVLLVVAALIPSLLFTAYVMRRQVAEQREILDRGMRNTVRALSLAIDGDINTSLGILRTLAASDALDKGDLRSFHALCVRATEGRDGAYIVLFDRSGQQIVNSSRQYGARVPLPNPLRDGKPAAADERYPLLPLGGPEPVRKVLETGKPVISDLFVALSTRRPSIGIHIPVFREGAVRYVLDLVIEPEPLVRTLLAQQLREDSVASLLDSRGVIIARTRDASERLGTLLAPSLAGQTKSASEGTGEGLTLDGVEAVHAFTHSAVTGWTMSLAVSREVVSASLRWSAGLLIAGAAVSLLVGIGAAMLVGRRISRPIAQLAGSAGAMVRGQPANVDVSAVRELRDLHGALAAAGQVVREGQVLREADRHKDEFLAMLGHELRNPLAALTTAAHVLRAAAPGDAATAGAQRVIERQTDHMVRLIDDLLDITRVRVGKISLQQAPLDLAGVVSEVVDSRRAAGDLAGRAALHLDLKPAWINGDRARVEQVFSNLLQNALKFTPEDGCIDVSVLQRDGGAVLRVSDSGRGIAAGALRSIFEPFVQGEQTLDRLHGGLGLGLSLVKRLAELHGGSALAESAGEGLGATFTVVFPAIAPPAASVTAPSQAQRRFRALRVLVVEDNPDARQMLRAVLVLDGHQVHEAATGPAGIQAAAQLNPDVVILDIGLPHMDGYQVARRLRALPGGDALALIALTGYGQDEDRDRARDAGFDAHLVKPASPERLSETLAQLMARHEVAAK